MTALQQQANLTWKKSTASGGGACVEVATTRETALVRDSKEPTGCILTFSGEEWRAFLVSACAGEFNV